jgi:hypothetical protein
MALKHDVSVAVLLIAFLCFGLMFFFFNNKAKSEVLISDRMSDFIDAIDRTKINKKNQLIIFDLDDTVFRSSLLLGTPTWYYNMVNIMRQNGAAQAEAFLVVGDIDRIIQENVAVVAVEQATLSAIKNWQESGTVIVAITSRPASFHDVTNAHLLQIGLKFEAPLFKCIEDLWQNESSKFENGVAYTGKDQTKDELFVELYALATECGLAVELLGQADDQQRYISKIAKFAADKDLNYIGIIYGGALSRIEFNIVEANQQLHELETTINRSIVPNEYRRMFANTY